MQSGEASIPGMSPDDLITHHLGLVDALARKILRGLPSFVDVDDLVAFGRIGLIESARRFDPNRGVLFKTFAYYRIRGAIYDGIRKMAWFSASSQSGDVTFEGAVTELLGDDAEQVAGGSATLDGAIGEAQDLVGNIITSRLLSLDATPMELPGGGDSPLQITEVGEIAGLLRLCLEQLDDKERSVIEDYYFNHLTLEEAGAKFGLSKSWTCRLHARALKKLMKLAADAGLTPGD